MSEGKKKETKPKKTKNERKTERIHSEQWRVNGPSMMVDTQFYAVSDVQEEKKKEEEEEKKAKNITGTMLLAYTCIRLWHNSGAEYKNRKE